MILKSAVFEADRAIPQKYSCEGADVSPPLEWSNAPEQTKSFVLICDDPDAPGGTFVHWVYYDIPATVQELPEGVTTEAQPSIGGVQGKNSFGKTGYGGPCPPGGTHRYFFKLYALNTTLGLPAGQSKQQVQNAMEGHVLSEAQLMGTYTR